MHGFPPRENAGTERVAAQSAAALRARGWEVHTLAATREPGARMYAVREEPGVSRLVQNAPYAALHRGGADPAARAWLSRKLAELRPDVVHVHHLAYLDPDFAAPAPIVWTLHDAWGWCAAGGQLFRDGAACAGPGPGCAACASAWVQDGPAVTAALAGAGALSRWVEPARLHGLWARVPPAVRVRLTRGRRAVGAASIAARAAAFRSFATRCAVRLSPSAWLARAAEAQGLGTVRVFPNGVPPGLPRVGGGPFCFLGTLAPHKGPALVVRAHARAGVTTPLRVHGPPGPDAAYAAQFADAAPLADPRALLASARALVLGSVWPENAPMVVLEARAAGCPVIAPAIGGLPELVQPGVDGWLYPPGDEAALAACIRRAEAEAPPPVRPPPTLDEVSDALVRVYEELR